MQWTRGRIKKLRTRLQMTQTAMASACGVSRETLARWEQKRKPRTPSNLAKEKLDDLDGGAFKWREARK